MTVVWDQPFSQKSEDADGSPKEEMDLLLGEDAELLIDYSDSGLGVMLRELV